MSFSVRSFQQIAQSMLSYAQGATTALTDYTIGSIIRTILEASAREISRVYQETGRGIQEAILENVYTTFNFLPLEPQEANGTVTFTRTSGTTVAVSIPNGTLLQVPGTGKYYKVSQDVTINTGSTTVNVLVTCTQTGVFGNTPQSTITGIVTPIANVASVTNSTALTNGADLETEDQRAIRFRSFIQSLQRGTLSSLAAGVLTAQITDSNNNVIEVVKKCNVIENTATGAVEVYIHNGSGSTSSALLTQANNVIIGYTDSNGVVQPGYKAAGIACTVYTAWDQTVTTSVNVYLAQGFSLPVLQNDIALALNGVFSALNVGNTLHITDLLTAVRSIRGILDCQVIAPTADVVPANPATTAIPAGSTYQLPFSGAAAGAGTMLLPPTFYTIGLSSS